MKLAHKFILILSVVLVLGFTWSLDMPGALEVPLRQSPYYFSNLQFNLIYFFTYVPICFTDVPLGMLLDNIPIRKAAIFIALISLISEVIVMSMFHFQIENYKIIIFISRAIFGIMGEGSFTILTLLISRFGGIYYDTLMGVGLCIPYFFDSLNNIVTPSTYDISNSMDSVWLIGTGVCALSMAAALSISRLVKKQDQLNLEEIKPQREQDQNEKESRFHSLKQLPFQFWIIVGAIFFVQYNIASYFDNLNDTIVKRFRIPYVYAGYLMFIPYGLAAIFSFILGKIIEINPKFRRSSIFYSSLVYSIGLLVLYLLPNIEKGETPLVYYFIISFQFITISYGLAILYTCLCPSIKYVVNERYLGVAWGVIGSAIGLSSAIGPLITAAVLQTGSNLAEGYQNLTLSIFISNFFAIIFSLWILKGKFQNIDANSSEVIDVKGLSESLDSKQQGLISKQNFI